MQKIMLLLWLFAPAVGAGPVFEVATEESFKPVWDRVYASLEAHRFYVIFEPRISDSLASFKKRWGDDYNRNEFSVIRSMVFCNPWYANQVSNLDPAMLALCPLHLTMTHSKGTTSVYFARPTVIAADSPALKLLQEVEDIIIGAIREGLKAPATR